VVYGRDYEIGVSVDIVNDGMDNDLSFWHS
jgi:hypothetical protein